MPEQNSKVLDQYEKEPHSIIENPYRISGCIFISQQKPRLIVGSWDCKQGSIAIEEQEIKVGIEVVFKWMENI